MPPPTCTYAFDFTTERDQIRSLIRDTDSNDWILADEEIAYYASLEGNLYLKAARCAEAAAEELGRRLSVKGTIDSKEQWEMMLERSASLRARGSTSGVAPYAGGIAESDKKTREDNTDRVQPAFRRDTHETGDVKVTTQQDRFGTYG